MKMKNLNYFKKIQKNLNRIKIYQQLTFLQWMMIQMMTIIIIFNKIYKMIIK